MVIVVSHRGDEFAPPVGSGGSVGKRREWRRVAARNTGVLLSFEQYAPEAAAEVLVEYRVDHRVDRRVHVAQPEGDGERLWRNVAHRAQGRQYVHEEERQPAGDERSHDQAEYERGAFLLLPGDPPFLPFRVPGLGPRLARRRTGTAARAGRRLMVRVMMAGHGHLARVQYVPLGLGRRRRFGRLAATEYRLAQPRLDRLHDAALLHVA